MAGQHKHAQGQPPEKVNTRKYTLYLRKDYGPYLDGHQPRHYGQCCDGSGEALQGERRVAYNEDRPAADLLRHLQQVTGE
jgi:hypothetical protein